MSESVLLRYFDPDVLNDLAHAVLEPRGLVVGSLAGAHRSPLAGFAVEFSGHRQYVAGDDPRHIDWRVYFRRDKYVVKQYELETNLVCHLVLDISGSMRYGADEAQKLRYAARLLATLAYAVIGQHDMVSLFTIDDDVRDTLAPSNSREQLLRLVQLLDQVQPVRPTDLTGALAAVAGRLGRREIVMIASDFLVPLPPLEAALQRLRFLKHEVVLFHVLHPDELTFPFGGMVSFSHLEGEARLLAEPDELRTSYLATLHRYLAQFEQLCQRNHCEYLLADTGRPLRELLVDYLSARTRRRGTRP